MRSIGPCAFESSIVGCAAAVTMAALALLFSFRPDRASGFALLPPSIPVSSSIHWHGDKNGLNCAKDSPPLVFNPCTIRFDNTRYTIPDWENTSLQAAAQWTLYDSTDGHLIFRYDANTGVFGQVFMYQGDLGAPDPKTNLIRVGNTIVYYSSSGYESDADVTMSTDASITWCTFTQSPCSSPTDNLEESMTHEIGHALGLGHPATGPYAGAVMQCEQAAGENDLVQLDDVQGERWLYGGGDTGLGPQFQPCGYPS